MTLAEKIRRQMHAFAEWLLNSKKHNPTSLKVTINNHSVSLEELKYLGVLLDNKLSWKPHVQKVRTQLSRACGVSNQT